MADERITSKARSGPILYEWGSQMTNTFFPSTYCPYCGHDKNPKYCICNLCEDVHQQHLSGVDAGNTIPNDCLSQILRADEGVRHRRCVARLKNLKIIEWREG